MYFLSLDAMLLETKPAPFRHKKNADNRTPLFFPSFAYGGGYFTVIFGYPNRYPREAGRQHICPTVNARGTHFVGCPYAIPAGISPFHFCKLLHHLYGHTWYSISCVDSGVPFSGCSLYTSSRRTHPSLVFFSCSAASMRSVHLFSSFFETC